MRLEAEIRALVAAGDAWANYRDAWPQRALPKALRRALWLRRRQRARERAAALDLTTATGVDAYTARAHG